MHDQVDTHPQRWRFVVLIGLGLFLLILNIDLLIVNLALPIIGKEFSANLSDLQWINNIYSLSMASTIIFMGILADRYGHRYIFLWGVVLFFIGLLIAGFAPSIPVIIIGRIFQGVGMGATFTMVFVLTGLTFPKNQQGLAIGILVISSGLGQAIGPSVGGLIIDLLSWRFAFFINAPICVFSFLLILIACKKGSVNHSIKIHYFSAFAVIILSFVILFALNQYQTLSLFAFLAILLIGIGLFTVLLSMQKRIEHPFIDVKIFHNHKYTTVNGIRILFQFCLSSFLFVFPLYLQNIEGFSAKFSGIVLLAMAIALAIGSPIAGKLNDHIGPEIPILSGQIFSLIGFSALAFMPLTINWILIVAALLCIGISCGITFSSTGYLVLNNIPPEKKGVGFAIFIGLSFFSFSVGIAITGYLLTKVSFSHFSQLLSKWDIGKEVLTQIEKMPREEIRSFLNGARPIDQLKTVAIEQGKQLIFFGKTAFLAAFHAVMALLAGLSFIATLLSITLLQKKHKENV